MNIGEFGANWSIGQILQGFIGFAVGVLIVVGFGLSYGVPGKLLPIGAVAVAGGFGSGLASTTLLTRGAGGYSDGAVLDASAAIAAASQFFGFLLAAVDSSILAPGVTVRLAVVIAAIIPAVITAVIGYLAGLGGSVVAFIVPEAIAANVSLFTTQRRSYSDDEQSPRVLVTGAIARLPLVLYVPIALVVLGWEWAFNAVGRTPPVNEYLLLRAETPERVGTQVRDELPDVSEYSIALDFGNYQQALEFLDAFKTILQLPDTIVSSVQAIIYNMLYLVSIVGIVELLLPVVIILSVLGMLPSYETGIPVLVFIGNVLAVAVVGVTLLLLGPVPLIGGGLTYQLGAVGKLHLLAILTHAVTGFVAMPELSTKRVRRHR